jgi:hypothetical protein
MKVFELLAELQKMPRDLTVEWIIDGEVLDDNGARARVVLKPDGYSVVRLLIEVKERNHQQSARNSAGGKRKKKPDIYAFGAGR